MVCINGIKIFVSNASPDIKEVLDNVNFIKNVDYKDSKLFIMPMILKKYNIVN